METKPEPEPEPEQEPGFTALPLLKEISTIYTAA